MTDVKSGLEVFDDILRRNPHLRNTMKMGEINTIRADLTPSAPSDDELKAAVDWLRAAMNHKEHLSFKFPTPQLHIETLINAAKPRQKHTLDGLVSIVMKGTNGRAFPHISRQYINALIDAGVVEVDG